MRVAKEQADQDDVAHSRLAGRALPTLSFADNGNDLVGLAHAELSAVEPEVGSLASPRRVNVQFPDESAPGDPFPKPAG